MEVAEKIIESFSRKDKKLSMKKPEFKRIKKEIIEDLSMKDYVAGLISYILDNKSLPNIYDKFSDNTSMSDFLKDNRKWIYLNRDDDYLADVLVMLIEIIDEDYFSDVKVKVKKIK